MCSVIKRKSSIADSISIEVCLHAAGAIQTSIRLEFTCYFQPFWFAKCGAEPDLPFFIRSVWLICSNTPLPSMISSWPPRQLASDAALVNQTGPTERHAASKSLPSALITLCSCWCFLSFSAENPSGANVFHFERLKDFWKQYSGSSPPPDHM